MSEPLSVGLAGIRRTALTLGDSCVIPGDSPIGLVTLAAAKALGVVPVLIYDIDEKRFDLPKKYTITLLPITFRPPKYRGKRF